PAFALLFRYVLAGEPRMIPPPTSSRGTGIAFCESGNPSPRRKNVRGARRKCRGFVRRQERRPPSSTGEWPGVPVLVVSPGPYLTHASEVAHVSRNPAPPDGPNDGQAHLGTSRGSLSFGGKCPANQPGVRPAGGGSVPRPQPGQPLGHLRERGQSL